MKRHAVTLVGSVMLAMVGCGPITTTSVEVVGVIAGHPSHTAPVLVEAADVQVGSDSLIVPRNPKVTSPPDTIQTRAVVKLLTTITDSSGTVEQKVLLGPMHPDVEVAEATVTASPTTYVLMGGWIYVWDHDLYVETDWVIAHVEGSSLIVARRPGKDGLYLVGGTKATITHKVSGNTATLNGCEYIEADSSDLLGTVQSIPDCPCPYDRGNPLGQFLDDVCQLKTAAGF